MVHCINRKKLDFPVGGRADCFGGRPRGGAIKNSSIGLGSGAGKCRIRTGGKSETSRMGGDQTAFLEAMAEAGKAVSDYLSDGERIVCVNVTPPLSGHGYRGQSFGLIREITQWTKNR